jgi:transcriptional regulator with XRE-family HTH domain
MRFLNLAWAIRQRGSQFRFAAALGESESWLSRRLNGRAEFSTEDRGRIAQALGYPAEWLFRIPEPPTRKASGELVHAHA